VLIDTLTGEYIILRVDIIHDAGRAINPAIELGLIEGGFVQGAGWLTMEEIKWYSNGQLTTHSPSTYKIPAVNDMPERFNVEIYKYGKNEENVKIKIGSLFLLHSKTFEAIALLFSTSVLKI